MILITFVMISTHFFQFCINLIQKVLSDICQGDIVIKIVIFHINICEEFTHLQPTTLSTFSLDHIFGQINRRFPGDDSNFFSDI